MKDLGGGLRRPSHRIFSALLVACLTLAGCADPRPRHVVFLLVDTLRADHLGAYGYGRPTSPVFDALARESLLFADARAQASCTFPSVNSLLTSRAPETFLGQPDRALGIPAGIPPLAEILRRHGYRTAAVSASPIVRVRPSRFNPGGGFGGGFELFDEECLWQSAACVNGRALAHLRPEGRPLFLYLHYMDPHGPYRPPPGHRRRFAKDGPERDFIRRGDPNPIADWLYKGAPDPRVTAEELRHLVDLYDEEISHFDAELASLLGAIERAGFLDDAILVVAADHGEEFLEHGHVKHCRTLFDSSIRVPLLLRIPGVEAATLRVQAQNLDLVPTLLDYLGIDAHGLALEGRSLRPAIERRAERGARQFASQGSLRSASDGRFKLVHDLATGSFSFYDLLADPGETRDVLRHHRRAFAALRGALFARLAATDPTGTSLGQAQEAERRLRALGYLE